MIVLYTLLLLLLGLARFLIGRRTASLERKYVKAATAAADLLNQPLSKSSYSGKPDPYLTAKRQYQLGILAQRRDALEAKHDAWQHFHERVSRIVAAVRGWRGKKLPYTFGVLDVFLLLTLLDYLAVNQYVNGRYLLELINSWLSN
jgi:hypothetical protein